MAQQRDQLASAVRLGAARHGAGVGVRFLWVLIMERMHRGSKPRTGGQLIRDALVTTSFGPEGRHHACPSS